MPVVVTFQDSERAAPQTGLPYRGTRTRCPRVSVKPSTQIQTQKFLETDKLVSLKHNF